MRDASYIQNRYADRRKTWAPMHAAGQLLRQVYNGEHNVILPELETSERVAVANLIMTGIDQHAMRIASTMPVICCPPMRVGSQAQDRADNRRLALQAWWYENNVPRQLRRRARHLIGYSMSPVLIRPGNKGYPIWEVRDPLTCFPAPTPEDDLLPPDVIFCVKRSLRWIESNYPKLAPRVTRPREANADSMFEVLQYIDADQISLIVLGKENAHGEIVNVELSTEENRAHRPLCVVPGRITLDRLQGQFDQMIGMYETQAKLWALQLQAIQRGIFPEQYAVSKETGNPIEISPADAYTGEIGRIEGGILQEVRTDPSFQNLQALDRLEAYQRNTGAVPAEFGGDGSTNVRTGRRGAQVMSSTVDYPIMEAQEIIAASLQEENAAAIDVALAWFPNTTKTFVLPYQRKPVTYTAAQVFEETTAQFVEYAYAGSDTNGLVIEGGQRIGMGTMSKATFMRNDPMVKDPDAEGDRIVLEGIQQAALASIQQQAADPNGPLTMADLARLEELVYDKNMPLYKAVQQLQKEIQQRQMDAQQGQLDPMAMQPGLAAPGAPGTAMAGQPIGPPDASMGNLTNILGNLRLQQRQSPAEAASPGG